MKDMIINETGNSRYLKSSIPETITFAQLVQMLREGTFPIDLNGINPAGIAQQGTPLNKENLLSDAAAAFLGLTDSDAATVSQAFMTLIGTSRISDGSVTLAKLASDVTAKSLGASRIAAGSYSGTGSGGPSAHTRIDTDFTPYLVIVMPATGVVDIDQLNNSAAIDCVSPFIGVKGVVSTIQEYQEYSGGTVIMRSDTQNFIWGDNYVSWYSEDSISLNQRNASGTSYYYVVIGE